MALTPISRCWNATGFGSSHAWRGFGGSRSLMTFGPIGGCRLRHWTDICGVPCYAHRNEQSLGENPSVTASGRVSTLSRSTDDSLDFGGTHRDGETPRFSGSTRRWQSVRFLLVHGWRDGADCGWRLPRLNFAPQLFPCHGGQPCVATRMRKLLTLLCLVPDQQHERGRSLRKRPLGKSLAACRCRGHSLIHGTVN